jgi:DNA-binding response OmpR family regulator
MARILLIDDDDLLRGVLAKALHHAGHEIIQASDGKLGVDLARATQVDLVITDLIMPVQEGVETIMTIHQERPRLPIIAMSGGVSNSGLYLEIAGKMGARRVLAKPFTPKELSEVIDEVMAEPNAAGERRE